MFQSSAVLLPALLHSSDIASGADGVTIDQVVERLSYKYSEVQREHWWDTFAKAGPVAWTGTIDTVKTDKHAFDNKRDVTITLLDRQKRVRIYCNVKDKTTDFALKLNVGASATCRGQLSEYFLIFGIHAHVRDASLTIE